jgi:hypothetical protein
MGFLFSMPLVIFGVTLNFDPSPPTLFKESLKNFSDISTFDVSIHPGSVDYIIYILVIQFLLCIFGQIFSPWMHFAVFDIATYACCNYRFFWTVYKFL